MGNRESSSQVDDTDAGVQGEMGLAMWQVLRAMRRARRRISGVLTALVVFAIALGVFTSLPPSTLRGLEAWLWGHALVPEDAVRPAAEPTEVRPAKPGFTERDQRGGVDRRVTISGPARVVDGDTMDVRGTRIRLFGIDAPERDQMCRDRKRSWACGQRATRALRDRIGNRTVRCDERDREDRIVAVCRAGAVELNQWMVREGWALAYRHFTRSYVDEENRARAARRGIWRGEFVPPWDWRRGKRLSGARRTAQKVSGGCRIKGNISTSGKRIYHVPGGRSYDDVRINTGKGERWFCSESEASRAGWRKSRE